MREALRRRKKQWAVAEAGWIYFWRVKLPWGLSHLLSARRSCNDLLLALLVRIIDRPEPGKLDLRGPGAEAY